MPITPINSPATPGIHRGFQGMRRVASEIASAQQFQDKSTPTDLARSLVELKQYAFQTKASVMSLKTIDDTLGTLLDVRA